MLKLKLARNPRGTTLVTGGSQFAPNKVLVPGSLCSDNIIRHWIMNGEFLSSNQQGNGSMAATRPLSALPQTSSFEASQPRGSSLLDRIRAQREREASMMMETSTSTIEGGGYHPPMADGGSGNQNLGRVSMDFDDNTDSNLRQGLLAGSSTNADDEYSMKEYFLTFVMDMYTLFRSLPILGQVMLIAVMIYLIWILI